MITAYFDGCGSRKGGLNRVYSGLLRSPLCEAVLLYFLWHCSSAARTALSLNYKFFKQSLVAPGQPLELYPLGMPESARFEGIIERYDGTPVREAVIGPRCPISTEGLAEGLYRFVWRAKGAWAEPQAHLFGAGLVGPASIFYVGSYAELMRDAEGWSRMAEERGVILLSPGYRVSRYGNPIDFAHDEEVLAAVRADYRIDATQDLPARVLRLGTV